jgi:hypothetical protein
MFLKLTIEKNAGCNMLSKIARPTEPSNIEIHGIWNTFE